MPESEPRPGTPFPSGSGDAEPVDPLAGDWSEGLRGPVRALGIPAPRLLGAPEAEPEVAAAAAGPATPAIAAPPDDGTVEAPDAWSVAGDDPLHSLPPPPSHGASLESALAAAALEFPAPQAPGAEEAAAEPDGAVVLLDADDEAAAAPTEAPAAGAEATALPGPDAVVALADAEAFDAGTAAQDGDASLEAQEGVVELPAEEALEAHDGGVVEAEPLAVGDDDAAPLAAEPAHDDAAPHAAEPAHDDAAPHAAEPAHGDAASHAAEPAHDDAASHAAEPAHDDAAPHAAEPAHDVDAWTQAIAAHANGAPAAGQAGPAAAPSDGAWGVEVASPAAPGEWTAAPAWDAVTMVRAAPAGGEVAQADWSAVASGPDWSAPAAAPPPAAQTWGGPPPAAVESAWSAQPAAGPVPEWRAPAPAHDPQTKPAAPSAMDQLLEEPPEPPAQEPKSALFAPLAAGESLSAEESVVVDEDPDLLVPFEPPAAPLAQMETVPGASGLAVAGEHRVAVHTRGGRTLRGSVRDIDLAKSQFSLQPQGGGVPEAVYHAEVKAIFFMMPPGERPHPGSGGKVRVTFADGRTIDGNRDGGEGKHGFFLVPADAARTNTQRIYVARDAVADVHDG